jgi:hypothetical protein
VIIMSTEAECLAQSYYSWDGSTCNRQARCVHFSTWRMTWTIRVDTRDLFGEVFGEV